MEAAFHRTNNSSEIYEVVLPYNKSFMEYHIKQSDPWKDALAMSNPLIYRGIS